MSTTWWQQWRTPITVGLLGGLGLLLQFFHRETQNPLWLLGAIISVLLAALSGPYYKHLDEKHAASVLERFQEQMGDGLVPFITQLVKVAEADAGPPRHRVLSDLVTLAVECARHVAGQNRVRATYYRASIGPGGSPRRLTPVRHLGRGTIPTRDFVEGTPEGDQVFQMLDRNGDVFEDDASKCTLAGWNPNRERDYETFISVPVRGSRRIYGMISVDAPTVGELTKHDKTFIKCVGLVLASGITNATLTERLAEGTN